MLLDFFPLLWWVEISAAAEVPCHFDSGQCTIYSKYKLSIQCPISAMFQQSLCLLGRNTNPYCTVTSATIRPNWEEKFLLSIFTMSKEAYLRFFHCGISSGFSTPNHWLWLDDDLSYILVQQLHFSSLKMQNEFQLPRFSMKNVMPADWKTKKR